MVGDITYIPMWEGWVYLASVIDCAPRKCAGWAMGDNYKTPLITVAIEMAARNLDAGGCCFSFGPGQQLHLGRVRSRS
jgi:putative transposase